MRLALFGATGRAGRAILRDSRAAVAQVLRESDLDWTLIRMPRLTAGLPGAGYRTRAAGPRAVEHRDH